jgi:hypothetical protein
MFGRFNGRGFPGTLRAAAFISAAAAMLPATGCSREPSVNILGSFFPSWIFCGLIGILLTVAVRLVFVRLKFEQDLWPPLLVYPCMAAFFTFTTWLLFFS